MDFDPPPQANRYYNEMNDARLSSRSLRPQLRATSLSAGSGSVAQILTDKQQAELGTIATDVRARARTTVYTADSPARSIFIIQTGMIKAFRDLTGREQRVFAFLFPGDVFPGITKQRQRL